MNIDQKFLKGLKFKGAERKIIEKDGRKTVQGVPYERPLKPEDVIGMKDNGDSIVIVTADGQKYTVSKKE